MKKHFAATAYIVSKINGECKVLLHKHKKLGIWIGIGGHIEENENPVQSLLREVKEETNLEISLINDEGKLLKTSQVEELLAPVAILEERIPHYRRENAHFHIDLIYFAFCKNPEKIQMSEKYGWFSPSDLKGKQLEKEVSYLSRKILRLLTDHHKVW